MRTLALLLSLLCLSPWCWAGASRDYERGTEDRSDHGTGFPALGGASTWSVCGFYNFESVPTVNDTLWLLFTRVSSPYVPNLHLRYMQIGGTDRLETGWAYATSPNLYSAWVYNVALNTSQWYHLCTVIDMTANPDVVTYYVDGTQNAGTLAYGSNNSTPQNVGTPGLYLSSDPTDPASAFDGLMAYVVAFDDRALSAVGIAELQFRAFGIEGGEGYFPMWGSDSPELDLSGNARTGTLTNTVESFSGPPIMIGDGSLL